MPLVAAAICPHPPLILPEIAVGAAVETDDLRAACDAAVATVAASGARTITVVGPDAATREHHVPFLGSFAAWGADVRVAVGPPGAAEAREALPLSLLVGGWLLGRADGLPGRTYRMIGVAPDETPAACADLGAGLRSDEPWAMLVMGDGSACRGPKSPGYDDPRAQPYDQQVARALADADPAALLGLDPGLSTELKAAGRAPWQVLAGAAAAAGGGWRGELTYDAAPYGVAYFVATWTRR